MRQVFITGGTGFIGSRLAEVLVERGDRVRCLVRDPARAERLRELGVELIMGDVTQPETLRAAVEGVELVFHAAGLLAATRADQLLHVNGQGSGNVAQACAEATRPPVLVMLSSLAAAGPVPRGEVRVESDPLAPISIYGRTKREGELAVSRWAGRVPTTVLRPGIVFGPRCQDLRPMLSTIHRFRFHPVPGWRCPLLSYIHVDDLVDVMLLAGERGRRLESPGDDASESSQAFHSVELNADLEGPTHGRANESSQGFYFVESGEHLDWARFGRLFAMALNRPYAPVIRLPDPLPWFLGAGSELMGRVRGRTPLLNMDKMREARATCWASSSAKATRELGFQLPRTLAERVGETAAWFRENGWL